MSNEVGNDDDEKSEISLKPVFTKTQLMDMNPSLENLVDALKRYFNIMEPKKCEDIVIALGNTGCGKSTLLGSIIMGSDQMMLNTLEEVKPNGIKTKRRIIKYKDDVTLLPFKIGHQQ